MNAAFQADDGELHAVGVEAAISLEEFPPVFERVKFTGRTQERREFQTLIPACECRQVVRDLHGQTETASTEQNRPLAYVRHDGHLSLRVLGDRDVSYHL